MSKYKYKKKKHNILNSKSLIDVTARKRIVIEQPVDEIISRNELLERYTIMRSVENSISHVPVVCTGHGRRTKPQTQSIRIDNAILESTLGKTAEIKTIEGSVLTIAAKGQILYE